MSKRVYFTINYQQTGGYEDRDLYVDEKIWPSLIQMLGHSDFKFFGVRDVNNGELIYINFSFVESIENIRVEEVE